MEMRGSPGTKAQYPLEEILNQSTGPEIISPKGVLVFDSGKDKSFDKITINLDITAPENNKDSELLILGYNKESKLAMTKIKIDKPDVMNGFNNNPISLRSSYVKIRFKVGENDKPITINNMTVKGIPSKNNELGISNFGEGGGNGMLVLLLLLVIAAVIYYLHTQGKIKIPSFEQRMASFGKTIKSLSRRR